MSDAQIVKELAQEAVRKVELVQVGEATLAAVPAGIALSPTKQFLDAYRLVPERAKGVVEAHTLDSFIELTRRFQLPESALFANDTKPTVQAVLNFSEKTAPRFNDHRVIYSFATSDEWQAWGAKDGEKMSQTEFAEFVEDHIADVVGTPAQGEAAKEYLAKIGGVVATPQRLLELSRGLSMRVAESVKEVRVLQSGETQIAFSSEHQDENGKPMVLPSAFILGIPVFAQGAAYEVVARLRYRRLNNGLVWFFELYRTDRILRHAFTEACELAQKSTSLPLFYGAV